MKKTVWTFGLISGAILSAMMAISMPFVDALGNDRGEILGYTTMVLSFLLVYFGVRSYRDNVAGGKIRFGRALVVGTLIMVVASVCYVATWEVIYFGIRPDYAARFEQVALAKARSGGGSPQAIQRKVADAQRFLRLYRNPAINAAITFLEPLPVGLVIALVSAGVLSRRRRREAASGLTTALP